MNVAHPVYIVDICCGVWCAVNAGSAVNAAANVTTSEDAVHGTIAAEHAAGAEGSTAGAVAAGGIATVCDATATETVAEATQPGAVQPKTEVADQLKKVSCCTAQRINTSSCSAQEERLLSAVLVLHPAAVASRPWTRYFDAWLV